MAKTVMNIHIDVDVAKEARRISRNRMGKIPVGGTFKPGKGHDPVDDDSQADPRIEFKGIDLDNGKRTYLVDEDIVLERFACNRSDFPLEYPKWRFVPPNEIWVKE
jgi:hypothetical protein